MKTKPPKTILQKRLLQTKLIIKRYPIFPYLLKWVMICLMIGILVGTAAAGFLISLDWATNFRENNNYLILFLPLAGFVVGWAYHTWGKEIEGGNNVLLSNIHQPDKIVPFKMAMFIYLGTIITHLFGGSAGREGTALQMAGAICDQLTKPLQLNTADRKTLLLAAIAAGFGAVFGTPLAGAVFALEVAVIGLISYRAIFPVFMAAIFADLVTHLWQAKHTVYKIAFIPPISFLHIFYAIFAGVIFGLCAIIFTKAMHFCSHLFKKHINYAPLRPFAGGLLVLLLVWFLDTQQYLGLGIAMISTSFEMPLTFDVFALKMLFTVITLSAGFKGGEVTPLFFIGATLGSALAMFIPLPFGLLAGMGFVAVFAGATNTPLACMLMGIELFGASCGVYVAIACIVSYLIAGHNSIYNKQKIGEPKI
jgi:H+/Cl- antiporter ClcA